MAEDKGKIRSTDLSSKMMREMVHDVGNPLQIILGRAQLLSAAVKDDKELLRSLVIIQQQCEKARLVLDDILTLFPTQDP